MTNAPTLQPAPTKTPTFASERLVTRYATVASVDNERAQLDSPPSAVGRLVGFTLASSLRAVGSKSAESSRGPRMRVAPKCR